MAKFFLTQKAVQDLTSIWEYIIEEWSEIQADKYYSILINGCREISQSPTRGKKYLEIYDGLYGQYVAKHIILYRIIDRNVIEIERLLHERMDVGKLLK